MLQPFSFQVSDDSAPVTAGAAKVTYRMPMPLQAVAVSASLTVPQSSGNPLAVNINKNGASILSTVLTFDNGEKTTRSASVPAVISGGLFDLDDELTIDVPQIGDGTAVGLKFTMAGYQPIAPLTAAGSLPAGADPAIAATGGAAYGNLNAFAAGNAAAFDGVTNKAATSCAAISHSPGYVGYAFPSAHVFTKVMIYGTNSGEGFEDLSTGKVTITIYGKSGSAPSGPTDGDALGCITFNNTGNESAGRAIQLNNSTAYDHLHAYINGGNFSTYCAQLVPFGH